MSPRDTCGECDVGTRRLLQGQPNCTNLFFCILLKRGFAGLTDSLSGNSLALLPNVAADPTGPIWLGGQYNKE